MPLNYEKINQVISKLLVKNNNYRPPSQHWITKFYKYYLGLKGGYLKTIKMKCLSALFIDIINVHFNAIKTFKSQYSIKPYNIINMDKKGFQMSQYSGNYTIFNVY